jgi:hypothetical protein
MARFLDFLCTETWTYDPRDRSWFAVGYHTFNLLEGAAWIVFGLLVLRRFLVHRRSRLELAYVAAFFLFGLTDFREAWSMPLWLLGVKLVNLIGLLWLRRVVMRRFYPESAVY